MTADAPAGTPGIVVGVDGSEPAARALRWAVDAARRTGGTVEAVHAYEVPVHPGPSFEQVLAWARDRARGLLRRAVAEAVGERPDVPVRESVRRGPPGRALVRAAAGADLLVVGSRGHGAVLDALLGSVAQYCAAHASCPVVVLPPACRGDAGPLGTRPGRPAPAGAPGD